MRERKRKIERDSGRQREECTERERERGREERE